MTADPSYDPGVADEHGTGGRAYDYGSELGFGFVTEETARRRKRLYRDGRGVASAPGTAPTTEQTGAMVDEG